jgi:Peptidase family M28
LLYLINFACNISQLTGHWHIIIAGWGAVRASESPSDDCQTLNIRRAGVAGDNMKTSGIPGSILAAFCVAALSSCGAKKTPSQKHLSVKLVSKNDESPFFARMATSTSRVIVSNAASLSSAVDVDLPFDRDLYVVELDRDDAAKLSSEVFREERIAFFTARDEREALMISSMASEFSHPRKISTDDMKQPTAFGPRTLAGPGGPPGHHRGILPEVTIDVTRMREDLESLSGARPVVVAGQTVTITNRATTDNKSKARSWLRASYEALGYRVTEHRYSSGINLIAEKRPANPSDDQIFLVSGHMDTVQTAGADDDGSGTISALTVARALANSNLRRTVRFVAFDEEERGLVGSTAYAAELSRVGEISKVSLINIEMTGYDSDNDGDFHTIDCNENSSPALSRALMSAIASEGLALKKVDACTNRSDHAAFWEHNRPAIVISQNFFGGDSNPCYHKSCDTVQQMNWDYMEKLTRAAANAVSNLNQ